MRSTRLMRLALALAFAAGLAAIVWSLLSRQPAEDPPPRQPLLEPEVESQSTAFEYAEKREGKTIFRVAADKSVQTRDGRQRMEDVLLELYGEQGEVSDTVRGRRALYRVGESKVEFTDDVEIRLVDGTVIRSQKVRADLEAEIVLIDRHFKLRRGRVSGEGRRLRYQVGPRIARMRGFRAEIPEGGDRIRLRGSESLYDLSAEYVELKGRASVRREPSLLSARRIEVWMDQQRRVRRILSRESARFAPGPSRTFAGAGIEHRFDPSSGRLLALEVRSAPGRTRGQTGRAVYEESTPEGPQRLEADLIGARPAAGGSSRDFSLGEMEASGQVRFTSTPLSIERADSQRFDIDFAPDGRSVRRVDLAGEVRVLRRSQGEDAGSESLESPAAALVLGTRERLESVTAKGPALLKVNRPEADRSLNARGGLRFAFSQGRLKSVLARGGCRLESREGREASLLQAPRIEARFLKGRPVSAWAGEGVHLTMGARETRSRILRLDYRQGLLAQAVQEGDFRLDDSRRGVALRTQRATYDPATQLVAAGGPGRHRLIYRDPSGQHSRPIVTRARQYLLDRAAGGIRAQGEVSSRIEAAEGDWRLEAEEMQLGQGRGVVYTGRPVLRRRGSEIRGGRIRLSTGDDSLLVEENVRSRFESGGPAPVGEGQQPRRYEIASRTLRLDPSGGRAQYRGKVRLKTRDLEVDAPSMDVLQGERPGPRDQASLSRIEAWDQVEARLPHSGRRALGERLVYNPRTGEAEMTGNPVRLFKPDPETGKMSKLQGRKLIFKVGGDSLRLLSSNQTATERP